MTNNAFFTAIWFSLCLADVATAKQDAENALGVAKKQAKHAHAKTMLLSVDGKSAFAVHASQTDLGRQVSDFLLDHSRRTELSTFSRETFEKRRLAPQKFVRQVLVEYQKKTEIAEAAEFPTILRMLNSESPIDPGIPVDELDLTQEDMELLRTGLLAKNLVLRSGEDIEVLKWSDFLFELTLFQFESSGKRIRQLVNQSRERNWPSCLRQFSGDRHQLKMAKLEKGILCNSISSSNAMSFHCAGTMPYSHHFTLFWIVDNDVNSLLKSDGNQDEEPWLVISVR